MFTNRFIIIAFFIALFPANVHAHDDRFLESLAKQPGVVALVIGVVTASALWFFTRSPATPSQETPADLSERLREENAKLKRLNEAIQARILELEGRVQYLLQMRAEEEAAANNAIERLEADIEHLSEMLERARKRHQTFAIMPRPLEPENDHLVQALRNANEDLDSAHGIRRVPGYNDALLWTADETFGRGTVETSAGTSSL